MNDFLNLSKWKIQPMFFSFTITVGIFILILFLENNLNELFFYGSLLLYLIIAFEQYVTANHYEVEHKKNTKKVYDLEEHKYAQYLHHLTIPTILYFFLILFIYLNQQHSVYFLILILSFVIFSILFENIYSFYKHKFILHKSTRYIYDLISIVIVFLSSATISQLIFVDQLDIAVGSFLYGLLILFILFLFLVRHFLTLQALITSIFYFIFVTTLFYLFILFSVQSLFLGLILTILFAIFLHGLNNYHNDGINTEDLIEYLILLLLISSLVYLSTS